MPTPACLSSTKRRAQVAHPPDGIMEKEPISCTTKTYQGDSIPEPGTLGPDGGCIAKWKTPVRFSALFPGHCDHCRDPQVTSGLEQDRKSKKIAVEG